MSWMCGGVSLQDSGTVERTGQGQGSVEVRAAFYAIEVGHRHARVMQGTWVTAKGGCRPAGRNACIGLKCPCRTGSTSFIVVGLAWYLQGFLVSRLENPAQRLQRLDVNIVQDEK